MDRDPTSMKTPEISSTETGERSEKSVIYTITVFDREPVARRMIPVGWTKTFAQALKIVEHNEGNISGNGRYICAVIEEVEEGVLKPADLDHRWFFRLDDYSDGFEHEIEPDSWSDIIGFSFGDLEQGDDFDEDDEEEW